MADSDAALDEVTRLREAIRVHRDAMQGHRDYAALTAIDIELWLTLKER